jgi:hypothetical protein
MSKEVFFDDIDNDNFSTNCHRWKINVGINLILGNDRSNIPPQLSKLYSNEISQTQEDAILDELFERRTTTRKLLKYTATRRKELLLKTKVLLDAMNVDNKDGIIDIINNNIRIVNFIDIPNQSNLENYFVEVMIAIDKTTEVIIGITTGDSVDGAFFMNCFSKHMTDNSDGLSYSDYNTIFMFRALRCLSRENLETITAICVLKKQLYHVVDRFLNGFTVQVINNVYGKNIATKRLDKVSDTSYREKQKQTGVLIKEFISITQSLPITYTQLEMLKKEGKDDKIMNNLTKYKKRLEIILAQVETVKALYIEE